MKKQILVALAAFSIAVQVFAQAISVENFSAVPTTNSTTVIQKKDGRLILASADGARGITLSPEGTISIVGSNGTVNGSSTVADNLTPSYQKVVTLAETLTMTFALTNSVTSKKIFTFPEGRILIEGVVLNNLVLTPTYTNNDFFATDNMLVSFGSASAAVATGTNLAGTAVDFIPKNATSSGVTNLTDSALAASAQFDGTSTAIAAWFNVASTATNTITGTSTGALTGTITFTYKFLGDN